MRRRNATARQQTKRQAQHLRSLLDALDATNDWNQQVDLSRALVFEAIALYGYVVPSGESPFLALVR